MKHAREDYDNIQEITTNGTTRRIPKDEPVFLLRAQDETAAATVRFWASLNTQGDQRAVQLALEHARKMDAWPKKKTADVAK